VDILGHPGMTDMDGTAFDVMGLLSEHVVDCVREMVIWEECFH
jgi:hypothetical protein